MKYPLDSKDGVGISIGFKPGRWYKCISADTSSFTSGKMYLCVGRSAGLTGLADNDGIMITECTSRFVEVPE